MGTVKSEPAYLPYLVFRSCDGLWLGPKSDGKASSNRQYRWAWIRGAEPEWDWMAGHHLQNGYGSSRFIKQSDWVGMFQPGLYWTLLKHEPHDPVSDKICLFRKLDVGWRWNQQLGFIQVYIIDHHRATRLCWTFWSGIPNFSRVIWCLGCSKDSLDPKLGLGHGLSRLCWRPWRCRWTSKISSLNQVEACRVWYIQCIVMI